MKGGVMVVGSSKKKGLIYGYNDCRWGKWEAISCGFRLLYVYRLRWVVVWLKDGYVRLWVHNGCFGLNGY